MQTIKMVFENCDSITIDGEITFDITQEHDDGICEIDNIKITIPKENNGVHYELGSVQWETTKFNRLLKYNDITNIEVDGVSYNHEWYEENEYCCSQYNEYQHTYKTENGDLVIEISSANKQRQTDNERIVELIIEYLEEYPTMTFGQVIHKIECKIGSSVTDAKNDTVIGMLEELLMEAI